MVNILRILPYLMPGVPFIERFLLIMKDTCSFALPKTSIVAFFRKSPFKIFKLSPSFISDSSVAIEFREVLS